MTETEANSKWCPFAASRVVVMPQTGQRWVAYMPGPYTDKETDTRCIASGCMAWRWDREGSPTHGQHGHCGLAGGS